MSDERDFERRVMAAAGAAHSERSCQCKECRVLTGTEAEPIYDHPRTPEGFVALWDALEARGWLVKIGPHMMGQACARLIRQFPKRDLRKVDTNRAAALLEAAAQALGVTR